MNIFWFDSLVSIVLYVCFAEMMFRLIPQVLRLLKMKCSLSKRPVYF